MKYKITINEEEYKIPKIVSTINEEIFARYTKTQNEELYLDIEAMKAQNKYNELRIIVDQSCNCIGMFSIENKEEMEEYSKLGPKMRFLDDMAKLNYEKGKIDIACQKLIDLLELVLNFYNQQLEKEEQLLQGRKTR